MNQDRYDYRGTLGLAGGVTPGIKGLIVANVSVFALQTASRLTGKGDLAKMFGLHPAEAFGDLRLWQLVTYMFLHSPYGLTHILFNMLFLWMFGTELERAWGTKAFLRYYFLCGIGGALTTSLLFWDSTTIGASGAVFGVMLAYGMLFPNRQILVAFLFPMRAASFVLLSVGIELFSLLSIEDGVAHIAHLGGMLFGYLYLRRAWQVRPFLSDLRWKLRRRRFKVVDRPDRRYPFH